MNNNNLLNENLAYNGAERAATRIRLLSYDADGVTEATADGFEPIEKALAPGRIHWVRIQGLRDTQAVQRLCTRFGVGFLTQQDILNVGHPAKVESAEGYHFVVARRFRGEGSTQISLVLGGDFVLSFSEGESAFFDEVADALRGNVLRIRTRGADYLFSVLLNSLSAHYLSAAREIEEELDDLESDLLSSAPDRDAAAQIQTLRRRYMTLRRTVNPLREQYAALLRSESPLLRKANRPFFNDVSDHLLHVTQTLDICRESLSSLMELYIARNDLRMNDIMKRLTVVSTIFIPLTFLVGVWGMNFERMPELNWRYGYAAAWGVMLAVGLATLLFFRTKKWR